MCHDRFGYKSFITSRIKFKDSLAFQVTLVRISPHVNVKYTMNFVTAVSFLAVAVLACEDCSGPRSDGAQSRIVRRMQPGALNATGDHFAPLEWGQLNFLHTTDTHGWLEGLVLILERLSSRLRWNRHLKEQNYGADWGDYASFTM